MNFFRLFIFHFISIIIRKVVERKFSHQNKKNPEFLMVIYKAIIFSLPFHSFLSEWMLNPFGEWRNAIFLFLFHINMDVWKFVFPNNFTQFFFWHLFSLMFHISILVKCIYGPCMMIMMWNINDVILYNVKTWMKMKRKNKTEIPFGISWTTREKKLKIFLSLSFISWPMFFFIFVNWKQSQKKNVWINKHQFYMVICCWFDNQISNFV